MKTGLQAPLVSAEICSYIRVKPFAYPWPDSHPKRHNQILTPDCARTHKADLRRIRNCAILSSPVGPMQ